MSYEQKAVSHLGTAYHREKRVNALTDADLQATINKVYAANKSQTNPVFSYCALPTGQGLTVLQRGPSFLYYIIIP